MNWPRIITLLSVLACAVVIALLPRLFAAEPSSGVNPIRLNVAADPGQAGNAAARQAARRQARIRAREATRRPVTASPPAVTTAPGSSGGGTGATPPATDPVAPRPEIDDGADADGYHHDGVRELSDRAEGDN